MGNSSPELSLIKSLWVYSIFIRYQKYLSLIYSKHNNKSLFKLYTVLSIFHEKYPERDIKSLEEFEMFFYSQYPASNQRDRDEFSTLFRILGELDVDPVLSEDFLNASRERLNGHRIALGGLEGAEGRKSIKDVSGAIGAILEASEETEKETDVFVSNSLAHLYQRNVAEPGIRWPLDCLNKSVGSLRKGDYGIIFARPETGKTTLVSHICSFAASQRPKNGPILWFNNEQAGETVQAYCYRSVLGLTDQELYDTIEENEKMFKEKSNDQIRIYDSASIHRKDIEDIIRRYGASLIVIDQIPKIKGFDEDRDDLVLGAIHQWARELAKRSAPVIGVCQAGESGANKRWLTLEDVANVKTAAQAEADLMIGIGKIEVEGYENVRFLNICKNKLLGDSDTEPTLRHARLEVLIDPQRARYKDI